MEVSGVSFVGFWKRAWASFSDALFFQLVAFLIVLAAFRSDYLAFIEAKFATIAALAEGPIDFAAVWKLDTTLNFGLDALLFNPSAPGPRLLPNLQIASLLHEMPRPLWLDCVSLVAVSLVFAVPPLFFRFSLRWLDRWWLSAMSLAFAGGLCNILERMVTGAVRDIYYVEGALRYLCLYCGLRHHSYFGNLADLYQGLGLYSLLIIFPVSRFWLIGKWFWPSGV